MKTSIYLSESIVTEARRLGINMSQVARRALLEEIMQRQTESQSCPACQAKRSRDVRRGLFS